MIIQLRGGVEGHVVDQFALDEKDGYLRVAATRGALGSPRVQLVPARPEQARPEQARPEQARRRLAGRRENDVGDHQHLSQAGEDLLVELVGNLVGNKVRAKGF